MPNKYEAYTNSANQVVTATLDVDAVLNVTVAFGTGIIAPVEKRIECFEDKCLILFS